MALSPLYTTVLDFCRARLAASTSGHRPPTMPAPGAPGTLPKRPLVVGIQGPQGGGKTTLTRTLLETLPGLGLTGVSVSVDDFYMTRAGQLEVAAAHPGNPYMEHRGYPGTHDVALGAETLRRLRAGEAVDVPLYDKSAHGGRGDRAPRSEWRPVTPPLDIVFIEGWMLGYQPVPESTLSDPGLIPANRALAAYSAWHDQVDAWVVLRALDPEYVLTWRVEAEERMKASGKPGLSREEIEDYIRRFLPAYRTWTQAPAEGALELAIDLGRNLVPVTSHQSPVTSHQGPVTSNQSPRTSHQ